MRSSHIADLDWIKPCSAADVEAAWEGPVNQDSRRVGSIAFSLKEATEGDAPRFRGSTTHGRYPQRLGIRIGNTYSVEARHHVEPETDIEYVRQYEQTCCSLAHLRWGS